MGIELVTATLIVIASFLIYFKTKEFYELSSHPGIRFFRYAFLFFGISFLLQLLRPLFHFLGIFAFAMRPITMLISVYAGTMALLCLLYSVLWRRVRLPYPFIILSAFAILMAAITGLARMRSMFLILQLVLFAAALIFSYIDSRNKRSKALQVHVLYTLLFLSWIAGVAARFAAWESSALAAALNIISVILFGVLLYKVLKRTAVGT